MRVQEPLSPEEIKYPEPCGRETLEVMRERWAKLYRDFYVKKRDTYDLSKIPTSTTASATMQSTTRI